MGLKDEIGMDEKPMILVNGHFYLSYEIFWNINFERLLCWNNSHGELKTYAEQLSKDRYALFVIQESFFEVEAFPVNENFMISERLNQAQVGFVEGSMILINRNHQRKMIDFAIITKKSNWYFCGNFCYVEQDNRKFCLFQN